MLSNLAVFIRTIISAPSSPKSDHEFDHKKLRIKIPVCTYITCDRCNNEYIKEYDKHCECLVTVD